MKANFTNLGDTHKYHFTDQDIEVTLDCFSNGRSDGWKAMCQVVSARQPHPGLLHHKEFNLASSQSQATLVKTLAVREPHIDWHNLLEYVSHNSVKVRQEGSPIIDLGSYKPPELTNRYLIAPILLASESTVLYGDGGGAKSLIALAMAYSVATGEDLLGLDIKAEGNVLYLDWESNDNDHYQRLLALVEGEESRLPHGCLHYSRQDGAISDIASHVRKKVKEMDIALVVVDSMMAARGGEPSSEEVVSKQFNSLRSLGVPTLCVDHVPKNPENREKMIGSVAAFNRARSVWYVEKKQTEGADNLIVSLTHKKANDGKIQRKHGWRILFATDGDDNPVVIHFENWNLATVPEFLKGMSQWQQIKQILYEAGEPLMAREIAERMSELTGKNVYEQNTLTVLKRYNRLFAKSADDGKWAMAYHE